MLREPMICELNISLDLTEWLQLCYFFFLNRNQWILLTVESTKCCIDRDYQLWNFTKKKKKHPFIRSIHFYLHNYFFIFIRFHSYSFVFIRLFHFSLHGIVWLHTLLEIFYRTWPSAGCCSSPICIGGLSAINRLEWTTFIEHGPKDPMKCNQQTCTKIDIIFAFRLFVPRSHLYLHLYLSLSNIWIQIYYW